MEKNNKKFNSILKINAILKKINELTDRVTLNLNPFLREDFLKLFPEIALDIKKLSEGSLLLKTELTALLEKSSDKIHLFHKESGEKAITAGLEANLTSDSNKIQHDLRNLINIINGYLEIVIQELKENKGDNSYTDKLSEIFAATDQILSLINEIKPSSIHARSPSPLARISYTSERKGEQGVMSDFANRDAVNINLHIDKERFTKDGVTDGSDFPQKCEKCGLTTSQEKIEDGLFRSFQEKYAILIVDDDKENCLILERYLKRIGYKNIHSVYDGFQALEMIKRFDLVLLDINMPGISGLEVLEHLKVEIENRQVMVLVISAADTMENTIECIKLGAVDFLNKPFNPEFLRVRIGSCVEKAWATHKERILLRKLEFEKQRYGDLLHAIFPAGIVKELIETGQVQTRSYPHVAILFVDVAGFTPYCDNHELTEIVKNILEFSTICEDTAIQNNMQKIKTIGDCFLGVSGMLTESENPVLDCINCAQEIIQRLANLPSKWKVHVGINYGTVMGGIVGKRQYLFDIWGNVVNIAERLQSMAEPNKIYLGSLAWEQVKDICKGHALEAIPIKGKSPIKVFEYEGMLQST